GAARATPLAVPAVGWPQLLFEMEGLVDAVLVVVAEDVMGAGHHASGAPGAKAARHHFGEELSPLGPPAFFGRCALGRGHAGEASGWLPVCGITATRSAEVVVARGR